MSALPTELCKVQIAQLLPSLKSFFYNPEQCSSFELLKAPTKLSWGQQKAVDWDTRSLRTEFEHFLSQGKFYKFLGLIYESSAEGH